MATILRKKEMNDLLGIIKSANFDPRKVNRQDKTNDTEFVIDRYCSHTHELQLGNSGVLFKIAVIWSDGTRFFNTREVSCTVTHNGPQSGYTSEWARWTSGFSKVEDAFKRWLETEARKYFTYLADEEEDESTPDLWSELDVASADLSDLENTPFREDERRRISETLKELLSQVQERGLVSEDAFRLLEERVEYSIESSNRLSRKDWIMATTGALMGYMVQVGLSAPVANQLLQLAADALNWIWIARPPLLHP